MGDCYASAIGTTVLQLKELPSKPASWDGTVCLFDVAKGVGEAGIKQALAEFGTIVGYEERAWPPVIVTFATHEAAQAAVQAVARLNHIAGGICDLFNDRAYDKRGW